VLAEFSHLASVSAAGSHFRGEGSVTEEDPYKQICTDRFPVPAVSHDPTSLPETESPRGLLPLVPRRIEM
jgi:hypothetical protein